MRDKERLNEMVARDGTDPAVSVKGKFGSGWRSSDAAAVGAGLAIRVSGILPSHRIDPMPWLRGERTSDEQSYGDDVRWGTCRCVHVMGIASRAAGVPSTTTLVALPEPKVPFRPLCTCLSGAGAGRGFESAMPSLIMPVPVPVPVPVPARTQARPASAQPPEERPEPVPRPNVQSSQTEGARVV